MCVRGAVDHLRPQLVELLVGVAESAGHGQFDDVRDRVAGCEQRRLAADRTGLLQDDPEVVRARAAEDRHACCTRNSACTCAPPASFGDSARQARSHAPADARLLLQLQRRRSGEGLHALPAQLALLLGAGEQLGRGPPVLGALHDVEHVQEVLVGAGQPDVQLLLAHESVRVRVGGVG